MTDLIQLAALPPRLVPASLIENVIIIIRQVYKGRGEKEPRLRVTGLPKKIVTGAWQDKTKLQTHIQKL